MTVFAICTEPGALDVEFAASLAKQLGVRLFDQRRLELNVAARCDFSDGKLHTFMGQGRQPFHGWDVGIEQLACRIREEILEVVAAGDALIVGWSAIPVLAPFQHVARVLVRAPARHRHQAAMRYFAYPHVGTAQLEVEFADNLIGRFVRRLFACDWRDPGNFDLILDAERVPVSLQAELVTMLVKNAKFADTPKVRSRVASALDMLHLHESLHPGSGPQPDVVSPQASEASTRDQRYVL